MTFSEEQVEWIVVEVLRRLGVAEAERKSIPVVGVRDLLLVERVITLRTIEGRLAGVSRVVIQPRAVVTPAVTDELKQRKIEMVREAKA
jgi:hypothetical protein